MKTFKENRAFVLGLIGEDWTRSADIFSKAERKMLSRHLKRALEDELIIVNRVTRNEVYYKKNPTDVELMLARVIKSATKLMANPRIYDDDYIKKLSAKIQAGQVDMVQLSVELGVFDRQKVMLNECVENLHGAYRSMLRAERPTKPSPWEWPTEYVHIVRDQLDEYLAADYEIHEWRTNENIIMKKVGDAQEG